MPAMSAATAAAAAAGAAMRSQASNGLMAAATPGSPYIAAAPMIRKMVTSPVAGSQAQPLQQQKLLTEEMMLEAAAVSQAPSEIGQENG